jgi:hypothetical protein
MSIGPAKPIASAHRRLTLVISIVFACIMFTVGGYAFLAAPRYVVLDIKAPDSYLPRGDWTLTTFSTNKFLDTQSRYFVWRQEAEVRTKTHDPQSPYDSWLSLKEYFDDRLADDEWTLYEDDSYDPCINHLPEAEFLPRGEGGYLVYSKPGSIAYAETPRICLAIWPSWVEDETVLGYNVVILTVNPSMMVVWNNRIDLGW